MDELQNAWFEAAFWRNLVETDERQVDGSIGYRTGFKGEIALDRTLLNNSELDVHLKISFSIEEYRRLDLITRDALRTIPRTLKSLLDLLPESCLYVRIIAWGIGKYSKGVPYRTDWQKTQQEIADTIVHGLKQIILHAVEKL